LRRDHEGSSEQDEVISRDYLPLIPRTENAVRDLELELVDLEDVQMFSERSKGDVVFDSQIYEIKKRVEQDDEAVAFGKFYKWKHDDLSQ
jgi:hypothetical protein